MPTTGPSAFQKLHLTTPPIKGDQVKEAQKALKENRFQNFHPGKTDGEYSEHTASAVRRAKYWCGFAKHTFRGPDRFTYGHKLHRTLIGERKLNALQRQRRSRRVAKADKQIVTLQALQLARTQIGTKESPPESNLTKYGKWYGVNGQPWCAIFVSWCIAHAKRPFFSTGRIRFHYAFVPFVVADAKAGRNGLSVVPRSGVRRGDIVTFDWEQNGVADHIGFFDGWINEMSGTFRTVEGNTAFGNDSNGGAVMARERAIGQVSVFVRVAAVGDAP